MWAREVSMAADGEGQDEATDPVQLGRKLLNDIRRHREMVKRPGAGLLRSLRAGFPSAQGHYEPTSSSSSGVQHRGA